MTHCTFAEDEFDVAFNQGVKNKINVFRRSEFNRVLMIKRQINDLSVVDSHSEKSVMIIVVIYFYEVV